MITSYKIFEKQGVSSEVELFTKMITDFLEKFDTGVYKFINRSHIENTPNVLELIDDDYTFDMTNFPTFSKLDYLDIHYTNEECYSNLDKLKNTNIIIGTLIINDIEHLSHELMHIYQHILKNEYHIINKYDKMYYKVGDKLLYTEEERYSKQKKYIYDFFWLLYLSLDSEIDARVQGFYKQNLNKNDFYKVLTNSEYYKYANMMCNDKIFDLNIYYISKLDYMLKNVDYVNNRLTQPDIYSTVTYIDNIHNKKTVKELITDLEIGDYPYLSYEECEEFLKKWTKYFNNQGYKIKTKLSKIYDIL